MRKIAFADIHGCNRSFGSLLDQVAPVEGDEFYFLGDYIDRGPDTKGVIDEIWKLEQEGFSVKCLKGNHEEMLLEGVSDDQSHAMWFANGGEAVLKNFDIQHVLDIPPAYLNWLKNLEYYLEVDEYILVHAGLNFDTPTPLDSQQSMLWIRSWYENINCDWLGDRIIIHGHTPIAKGAIVEQLQQIDDHQYLDIDAGCVHKNKRPWLGNLCAFDMTNRRLYFQENIDF